MSQQNGARFFFSLCYRASFFLYGPDDSDGHKSFVPPVKLLATFLGDTPAPREDGAHRRFNLVLMQLKDEEICLQHPHDPPHR